jgi:hypothetical protein
MTTSVSDIRVVPVGEDLTTEDLSLSVLRGLEKMYRVDKKLSKTPTPAYFSKGEWAVLDSEGKAQRCSVDGTANGAAYLVFCGTDRFDSKANDAVTLIMSHPIIVKTNVYDKDVTDYAVGDYLTAKGGTNDESFVTKWEATWPKHGRVVEVGDGFLVYETLGGV